MEISDRVSNQTPYQKRNRNLPVKLMYIYFFGYSIEIQVLLSPNLNLVDIRTWLSSRTFDHQNFWKKSTERIIIVYCTETSLLVRIPHDNHVTITYSQSYNRYNMPKLPSPISIYGALLRSIISTTIRNTTDWFKYYEDTYRIYSGCGMFSYPSITII